MGTGSAVRTSFLRAVKEALRLNFQRLRRFVPPQDIWRD
jgi:hypothetical protein